MESVTESNYDSQSYRKYVRTLTLEELETESKYQQDKNKINQDDFLFLVERLGYLKGEFL